MARKSKTPPLELPVIPLELVDQFVKDPMTAEAVTFPILQRMDSTGRRNTQLLNRF